VCALLGMLWRSGVALLALLLLACCNPTSIRRPGGKCTRKQLGVGRASIDRSIEWGQKAKSIDQMACGDNQSTAKAFCVGWCKEKKKRCKGKPNCVC
jgi:hypothetical protein